jgi:hypothetical protein
MARDHVAIVQIPTWIAFTALFPNIPEAFSQRALRGVLARVRLAKLVGGERQNVMAGLRVDFVLQMV